MSENNNFKYSGTTHTTALKVATSKPLDTRTVVLNKAALTSVDVAEYAYYGMIVYVEDEKKHYYLVEGDNKKNTLNNASNIDNWKEVGVDEDKIQNLKTYIEESDGSQVMISSKNTIITGTLETGGIYNLAGYITGEIDATTLKMPIYDKSGNTTTGKYASLQIIETGDGDLTIKIKKLDN